jgi:hypothetical protein
VAMAAIVSSLDINIFNFCWFRFLANIKNNKDVKLSLLIINNNLSVFLTYY